MKANAGTVKLLKKGKAGVPNNYPPEKLGDSEVEVELNLPADFQGEAVKLTVVTAGGSAEPLTVLAAKGATAEKEPNDGFDKAQKLALPATVDATIGRERDTDVFQFTGKKGQKVRLLADSLGSPADLLLTVYDANRQVLLTVDDADGKPHPKAELTLPADGVYFVSVIEAHDLGGPQFGYRLTVK
ncbi:MAG: PPC domain-containing protein [Fimbriiglobus sp.]|nr:PPC domain-containing protein [Fimbriiglobus sp.]